MYFVHGYFAVIFVVYMVYMRLFCIVFLPNRQYNISNELIRCLSEKEKL